MTAHATKQNTREQLVLAAMELFSEQGIRATSLRQVNEAAGTKNSGAVHYYFKNKIGLIEAVVSYIYENLIIDTSEEELEKAGLPLAKNLRGVRRIVYEHFLPLAVTHDQMPWGKDAVGFLAHLMMESDPQINGIWHSAMGSETQRVVDTLSTQLPAVPRAAVERRYLFAIVNLVHGLADSRSLTDIGFGNLEATKPSAFFVELVDYISAGIKAKP